MSSTSSLVDETESVSTLPGLEGEIVPLPVVAIVVVGLEETCEQAVSEEIGAEPRVVVPEGEVQESSAVGKYFSSKYNTENLDLNFGPTRDSPHSKGDRVVLTRLSLRPGPDYLGGSGVGPIPVSSLATGPGVSPSSTVAETLATMRRTMLVMDALAMGKTPTKKRKARRK